MCFCSYILCSVVCVSLSFSSRSIFISYRFLSSRRVGALSRSYNSVHLSSAWGALSPNGLSTDSGTTAKVAKNRRRVSLLRVIVSLSTEASAPP